MTRSLWKPRHVALLIIATMLLTLAPLLNAVPAAAQDGEKTHVVQPGENLFRIALNYNVSVEYLASINGIPDPTKVYVGQVLIIPDDQGAQNATAETAPAFGVDSPAVNPAPAVNDAPAPEPVIHTVQPGEHLTAIAEQYGVDWQDIAAANGLNNPSVIHSGQQLIIPGATVEPAGDDAPADVEPVAAAPTPVLDLGIIDPATINPPADEPAPAAPPAAHAAPVPGPGDRTHVVLGGEHLASIAQKYGLRWPTLAMANNIADPNAIYPGQTLIVPAQDYDPNGYVPPANVDPTPAATIPNGKQIIVDLSSQRVYAYQDGALVRNVLVSTGVAAFPTVQGDYAVYLKYAAQNMSGPGYYLPNVPYVLYFYQGYSLHGTYWHSNWGTPMSHGCVNMPTPEAEWLYHWAPIGTPVRVQW